MSGLILWSYEIIAELTDLIYVASLGNMKWYLRIPLQSHLLLLKPPIISFTWLSSATILVSALRQKFETCVWGIWNIFAHDFSFLEFLTNTHINKRTHVFPPSIIKGILNSINDLFLEMKMRKWSTPAIWF